MKQRWLVGLVVAVMFLGITGVPAVANQAPDAALQQGWCDMFPFWPGC